MINTQDTSIEHIVEVLKNKSETSVNGKMGKEIVIDKSVLALAAAYLEDYLCVLENSKYERSGLGERD